MNVMIPRRLKYFLLAAVCCIGVALAYAVASYAYKVNGEFSFPSDKPWIHLRFAESVHDYRSYSFYRNTMVVSGSTSPLYVFLLAFGIAFTHNEFLLNYILGVGSILIAVIMMYNVCVQQFSSSLVALGAALLVALEARLQWAALAGVETTLFIAILLASIYQYQKKNWRLFALLAGILIWVRPEAVLFYVAVALDFVYRRWWLGSYTYRDSQRSKLPLSLFGLLVVGYCVFNLSLSGSIIPRTIEATIALRNQNPTALTDVFRFFGEGSIISVTLLALVGVAKLVNGIRKREDDGTFVPLLFCLVAMLTYWLIIPADEQTILMLTIPCVILLAVSGVEFLATILSRFLQSESRLKVVRFVLILIAASHSAIASWNMKPAFAAACDAVDSNLVRTARWLYEHTPKDAVIATDKIGTVAFYGERRVLDVVGRVSPQMISSMNDPTKFRKLLSENKVTHIVMPRNRIAIPNQESLFFSEKSAHDALEVFEFNADQTEIRILR